MKFFMFVKSSKQKTHRFINTKGEAKVTSIQFKVFNEVRNCQIQWCEANPICLFANLQKAKIEVHMDCKLIYPAILVYKQVLDSFRKCVVIKKKKSQSL